MSFISGLRAVGDQAAIAQRPWAELRAVLKPADHLLVGEQLGGIARDVVALGLRGLDPHERLADRIRHLLIGVAFADIGMIHHERARLLENLEPAVIGAADCDAVVTGGGLNPDIVEFDLRATRPLATQFKATPLNRGFSHLSFHAAMPRGRAAPSRCRPERARRDLPSVSSAGWFPLLAGVHDVGLVQFGGPARTVSALSLMDISDPTLP
jgi:hypothetical protein